MRLLPSIAKELFAAHIVLVHAGMAIQIVKKDEAKDWIALFKEIGEEMGDE